MIQETSLEAYEAIKPHAATCRQRVYEAIENAPDGMTRQELETLLKMQNNTLHPRVVELVQAGKVYTLGTRKTRSGRNAGVLRVR